MVPTATKLTLRTSLTDILQKALPVRVYETQTPLGAGAAFDNIPLDVLKVHWDDTAFVAGDWIYWGEAEAIRVRCTSDQASAANGLTIEECDDPTTPVPSNLLQHSIVAATPYDSGWIARTKKAFRLVYTNGATPQTTFDLLCDVGIPEAT